LYAADPNEWTILLKTGGAKTVIIEIGSSLENRTGIRSTP